MSENDSRKKYYSKYLKVRFIPIEEYEKRKKEQIKLIKTIKTKYHLDFLDCDYENNIYNDAIIGYEHLEEGGNRCHICFNLRLEKTAKLAKENKYDYFCSTLTVSPHKNSKIINESKITLEDYIDFFELGKFYSYKNYLITRQNTENIFIPKSFESAVVSEDNTGAVIITFKII